MRTQIAAGTPDGGFGLILVTGHAVITSGNTVPQR